MKLYIETVSSLLWESLEKLMAHDGLKEFRLVGGTALSLQCGHRISIDIDLFTDSPYNSVDFYQIDQWIKETFDYVEMSTEGNIGFGKSYYVGSNSTNLLKLDFFYTDQFHKVIRNSGFIISTILIRLSFSVDGFLNNCLIIGSIGFGLLILWIHNRFEKNISAE